jgi:hypothetical protein
MLAAASETSVNLYQTIWHHIPEESVLLILFFIRVTSGFSQNQTMF